MYKSTKNISDIIVFPEDSREITLPKRSNSYLPLKEMRIDLAGLCELTRGYEIARSNPDFHLAVFTIDGSGCFFSGKKRFNLEKGSLFISPAGASQHYFTDGDSWKKCWMHLEDCDYWNYLKQTGPLLRNSLCHGPLENSMKGFVSEVISNMPESNHLARMYADIICVYLRRELKHSVFSGDAYMHARLSHLWDNVYKDLKRKWNLGDMARDMFLSPAHFSRICKEYCQKSPIRIVTKLRMQRAEELLKSSNCNLNVIAEKIGYDNEFAFSTAFKRLYGISPREFRKN
jgi:AraC-like DNA-binding protein